MRLGARRTVLQTVDCIAAKLYQSEQYVDERHRHRWVGALGFEGGWVGGFEGGWMGGCLQGWVVLPLRSCGAAVCMWVYMLRRFRIHPTSWHVDTPTPLTHCPLPCRYEVNPELVDQFEAAGLRFVGKDDSGTRMEIVELSGHPFFVAAQVGGAGCWGGPCRGWAGGEAGACATARACCVPIQV
jgi:hypothetical protein